MIRKDVEYRLPGRWRHAAARTFSPRRGATGNVLDMAAHLSRLERAQGSRWLMLAAETAGLAGRGWSSSPPGPAWRPVLIATRALGADAGSVPAARDFTLATLRRWDVAERGQDVAIVVSELVTNALRHAVPGAGSWPRRPIRLGLLCFGPCVLCAVGDPSQAVPASRPSGSLAETGRGLHIICALSDQWGYTTPNELGKVVWATFYRRSALAH
jgi:hypothetical protein